MDPAPTKIVFTPLTGGCACSHIHYSIQRAPLIIHGCHCCECQIQSGSAFVINIVIESCEVKLDNDSAKPIGIHTPSSSGAGQLIFRCPKCYIAVWSLFGGAGPALMFLRATTLDVEHQRNVEPDVHIYTKTKVPWLTLPCDRPVFEKSYQHDTVWSKENLERKAAIMPLVKQWLESGNTYWPGQAGVME